MKLNTAVNVREKAQHLDALLEKKAYAHLQPQRRANSVYCSHKCVHVPKSLTDTYQSQLRKAQRHLLLIEEIIGGF